MRMMNWNIEHMNSWWEPGNANPPVMRESFDGNSFSPPIKDVPALAKRVGNVINAVDPDLITIQEGAGAPEMKDFFNRFVNADWHIIHGSGKGQALVVAARLDRDISSLEPGSETVGAIDLTLPFKADVNADLVVDDVKFARTPQVVNVTAHGQQLLVLNNHLKSKFVQDGEALFNAGGKKRQLFFANALKARRRISGEAFRIRAFLNEVFIANPDALVVVAGDLNDGEGADFFEENFLTHSVVDRIFGSIFRPKQQLTHVLFASNSTDFTAQFSDFIAGKTMDLVIDHIGLSPAINDNWNWEGHVAVAEYKAQIRNNIKVKRDRLPSDHRPVVAEMTPG